MTKGGQWHVAGAHWTEVAPMAGKLAKVSSQARLTIMSEIIAVASGGAARSIRFRPPKAAEIEVQVDSAIAGMACVAFLQDESPKVRREFVQRLGESDWRERGPLLGQAVFDPDPRVHRIARALLRDLNWPVDTVISGLELLHPTYEATLATAHPAMVTHPSGTGSMPSEGRKGGDGDPPTGGGNGGDSRAPGSSEELRPGKISRFTEVALKAGPATKTPSAELTFVLRVDSSAATGEAIDVFVAAGKTHATVLVHASSREFQVAEAVKKAKVPRNGDSEAVAFTIRAAKARTGAVTLLVYDQIRLIGSMVVRLKVVGEGSRQLLQKSGEVILRDPARAQPLRPLGVTIQVSLTADDRIAYYALLPRESEDHDSELVPMGRAPVRFTAERIQSGLNGLRKDIEAIGQILGTAGTPGAPATQDTLDTLKMNLVGAGLQIGEDLLSSEVRTLFGHLAARSVVHWVIGDQELLGTPWELACDPVTRRFINESLVIARVPVLDPEAGDDKHKGSPSELATPPSNPGKPKLVYVLGEDVAEVTQFKSLRSVIQAAGDRYQVITNFGEDASPSRTPVINTKLQSLLSDAEVIHILCHGVVDSEAGLGLEVERNVLGTLRPHSVRALQLSRSALVFVNACSSAAGTMSAVGFTTFGWSFLLAGAGVYIGALAPVTVNVARRFAREFFDAHLGRGENVAAALYEARKALADDSDPTWALYVVYGDLCVPELSS